MKTKTEKPELFILKDFHPDGSYSYEKRMWKLPSEVAEINREVAQNVSLGIYHCGFEWVPIPPKPSWYGIRHICSARSICETFKKPDQKKRRSFHCICGRVYWNKVHFRIEELEKMSPEERLYL